MDRISSGWLARKRLSPRTRPSSTSGSRTSSEPLQHCLSRTCLAAAQRPAVLRAGTRTAALRAAAKRFPGSSKEAVLHLADFDYDLPERLIAQEPAPERDQSRLMVVR